MSPKLLAGALALLFTAALVVVLLPGKRAGSESGEAHTVRQVTTQRIEGSRSDGVLIGESWTLVDKKGAAVEFIGHYYSPDGQLLQAQHRTSNAEMTYWASYQGRGSCVEHAPAAPRGLESLAPRARTPAQMEAAGYTQGGTAGAAALTFPGVAPEVPPLEAVSLGLEGATFWEKTEVHSEASRRSTVALNSDGLTVGFWSETRTTDGERVAANSAVTSIIERYPVSVFELVVSESEIKNGPAC
jgi:hypothetical protein